MVMILIEATRREYYIGIEGRAHKNLTKKEKIMKEKTAMSVFNLEI